MPNRDCTDWAALAISDLGVAAAELGWALASLAGLSPMRRDFEMAFVPNNQPVSYTVYKQAIGNAIPASSAFIEAQAPRIARAFEAGEPLWMIIASTKMV